MSEVDQQTSAVLVEDQGVTAICVENELQRDIWWSIRQVSRGVYKFQMAGQWNIYGWIVVVLKHGTTYKHLKEIQQPPKTT